MLRLVQDLMLAGRALNKIGAALEKHRSPNGICLVLGTVKVMAADSRVWRVGW